MERNSAEVAGFARNGAASRPTVVAESARTVSAVPVTETASLASVAVTTIPSSPAAVAGSSGPAWQQVGFYRSREYAEELVLRLKQKGFEPVIRSETRPSGTVYHAVLVPEDSGRTMGARLKDAGFESYLRTE
jgi:cell division protein FtsN